MVKPSTIPILGAIGYAAALPASLREEDNQISDASPAVNPVYPSFSGSQPNFGFWGGVKPYFPGYTGDTSMAAPASQGGFGVGAYPSMEIPSTGAVETDGAGGDSASTTVPTSAAPEQGFSGIPGTFPAGGFTGSPELGDGGAAPAPTASWSGPGFSGLGGFSSFGFGAPSAAAPGATTSTTAAQTAAAPGSTTESEAPSTSLATPQGFAGFGGFGGFGGFAGIPGPASASTSLGEGAPAPATPGQGAGVPGVAGLVSPGAAGATGSENVIPGFGTTTPEREDDGERDDGEAEEREDEGQEKQKKKEQEEQQEQEE
ncbi:uncharacterized protein BDV14DRAFT_200880 [Aspergillus stella-maris]|uniref:uncharacterized protein n=1 Tax=Aspergillus stella-maris TaxID=1810926 RepID=UPI003CCDB82D